MANFRQLLHTFPKDRHSIKLLGIHSLPLHFQASNWLYSVAFVLPWNASIHYLPWSWMAFLWPRLGRRWHSRGGWLVLDTTSSTKWNKFVFGNCHFILATEMAFSSTVIAEMTVQLFFCYRIYKILKNRWIPAIIGRSYDIHTSARLLSILTFFIPSLPCSSVR